MKYKLHMRTPAALFLIIVSIATVVAQPAAGIATAIDPATGLPVAAPVREWKSSDWNEPAKVLPQVNFDGLPVAEVVRYLREQYSNDFDIVIPSTYAPVNSSPATSQEPVDPNGQIVKLQLRNVTASEVFHAMNLQFEAQNDPVQWQLMMNGNRPTALLRVVPELLPHAPPPPPAPEIKRMVFFIGNLIGDEKSGGMTTEQIVRAVSDTHYLVYPNLTKQNLVKIDVYKNAPLLIAVGEPDQIDLVRQTLEALKQKVDWERKEQSNSAEPNSTSSKPNSGASAGSK